MPDVMHAYLLREQASVLPSPSLGQDIKLSSSQTTTTVVASLCMSTVVMVLSFSPEIVSASVSAATQAALMEMNDSALTVDQLDALSRAVPDDQERKDIRLYLQVSLTITTARMFSC